MIRSSLVIAALTAALALGGCGPNQSSKSIATTPDVLNFSILSAENQQSMGPLWQPLLDDLQKQTGLKVKPFFASNYTSLVEAMRFNHPAITRLSKNYDRESAQILLRYPLQKVCEQVRRSAVQSL